MNGAANHSMNLRQILDLPDAHTSEQSGPESWSPRETRRVVCVCGERSALRLLEAFRTVPGESFDPFILVVDRRREVLVGRLQEQLFDTCEQFETEGWRLRELSSDHRLRDVALQLALARSAPRSTILFVEEVDGISETEDPDRPAGSPAPVPDEADLSATGLPFAVSAESARFDQLAVRRKPLRGDVRRWIAEYDSVGDRGLYLWRWCLHGIELTTFPDVVPTLRRHVNETKLLSVILCVLFDDVADRRGRPEFLESLIQSALGGGGTSSNDFEQRYIEVTGRLWREYEARIQRYPRSREFDRLLRFDLSQFFSAMRYAHLVNDHPGLLNRTEHDVYTPHNMLMVSFSTIDVMCAPGFDSSELGDLREAMWHAQSMGRIGNVLSTWEREMKEEDYSSVMFLDSPTDSPAARGAWNPSDSTAGPRATDRQSQLVEKWRWHRGKCLAAAARVQSLRLADVLSGHDRFWDMHLASSGLI